MGSSLLSVQRTTGWWPAAGKSADWQHEINAWDDSIIWKQQQSANMGIQMCCWEYQQHILWWN